MTHLFKAVICAAAITIPTIGLADTTCTRSGFRDTWFIHVPAPNMTCELNFYGTRGRYNGSCIQVDFFSEPPTMVASAVSGILALNPACGFAGDMTQVGGDNLSVTLEGQAWTPISGRPTAASGMAYAVAETIPLFLGFTMHQRPDTPEFAWPTP